MLMFKFDPKLRTSQTLQEQYSVYDYRKLPLKNTRDTQKGPEFIRDPRFIGTSGDFNETVISETYMHFQNIGCIQESSPISGLTLSV